MKMTLLISRIIFTAIILVMAYFALQKVWSKHVDIIGFLKKPSEAIPVKEQNGAQQYILTPAQSKASLSKPQSIPPNQETKIEFDTEIFDTHNEFHPEDNMWQASRTALYKIDLNLQIEKITEQTKITVIVRASNESFFEEFSVLPGEPGKIKFVKSVDNDAYDTIKVFIQHNYKENISLINDSKSTYLLIEETNKRI